MFSNHEIYIPYNSKIAKYNFDTNTTIEWKINFQKKGWPSHEQEVFNQCHNDLTVWSVSSFFPEHLRSHIFPLEMTWTHFTDYKICVKYEQISTKLVVSFYSTVPSNKPTGYSFAAQGEQLPKLPQPPTICYTNRHLLRSTFFKNSEPKLVHQKESNNQGMKVQVKTTITSYY